VAERDAVLARIRLRHLQAFLAVVQCGTFRRAAEALSISQPAVTKTLNELEEVLGVRLFERGRRGATLTPDAEVFLRHAQASVNALAQAVDGVRTGHDETPLRLGALPTVAPSIVANAVLALRARRPLTPVRVTTGRNGELIALLRQRELDAVVGRLAEPDEMAGLTFELLYAEPLAVVGRRGHPLARAGTPSAASIAGLPLVLPQGGTVIRHSVDSYFAGRGIVPASGVTETLSVSLARALVLGSDALWFTPPSAAAGDLAAGTLVRLRVDTAGTEEPVGLLLRTDTPPSAALAALLAALRAEGGARRATVQRRRRVATPPTTARPASSKA
jgi:LysR family transcriptional regulator, pca operon transcriptional activator